MQFEEAYNSTKRALQAELLEILQSDNFHWRKFEALVVDLLVKMGYGGSHKDAGNVTQATKNHPFSFSNTALENVKKISEKVIFIDGLLLTELMIDYYIGVSTEGTYTIKRLDSDYFEL